jgi:hypothetical protein
MGEQSGRSPFFLVATLGVRVTMPLFHSSMLIQCPTPIIAVGTPDKAPVRSDAVIGADMSPLSSRILALFLPLDSKSSAFEVVLI